MSRKTVIIIPDGCADHPVESLGGKTPLQAARLPAMDAIARMGVVVDRTMSPHVIRPKRSSEHEPVGLRPRCVLHRSRAD